MPDAISTRWDQRLRLQNTSGVPMAVYFEPWGDRLMLGAGEVFQIIASGPNTDCLQVEVAPEAIAVYAWTGAILAVYLGSEMVREYPHPAPALPVS